MSEHKEIWLEPRCNKVGAWCQRAEDRLWCEDGTLAACEDCGKGAVKYVPATDTEARADAATDLLAKAVEAIDSGNLQMDSAEIDDSFEYPPHPWHEEWLHYVRAFLAETAPKPVRLGDEGEG